MNGFSKISLTDFPVTCTMGYRFAFNGQEKDDEIKGSGNHLDFKFRGYDSRTGRFWSVDPLFKTYPYNSSYAFAENSPIWGRDLEGRELQISNTGEIYSGPVDIKQVNQQNIKNNLKAVVEYSSRSSSPAPKDQKEIINLQFKVEAGLIGGVEAKVLGVGAGIHVGASKALTTATYSENGVRTETLSDGTISASGTFGATSIGGSATPASGDAEVYSSYSVFEVSKTLSEDMPSTKITIFDFKASFLIGGSIKLTVNVDGGGSEHMDPNIDPTKTQRDNTNIVIPYRLPEPDRSSTNVSPKN